MKVLLYRVDDRLIHGQVVLGWGRRLAPRRIVVVDDRIAGDEWERELLAAAAPVEMPAEFLTVAEAARALGRGVPGGEGAAGDGAAAIARRSLGDDSATAFVLLESPAAARQLADAGFVIPLLNLGGLHRSNGVPLTPYLFLGDQDFADLRELAARGCRLYAQDVPDGKRVDGDAILSGRSAAGPRGGKP